MSKSETLEGKIDVVCISQIGDSYARTSISVLTPDNRLEIADYVGKYGNMQALYQSLEKRIGAMISIERSISFLGDIDYKYPVFIKEATKNEP